MKNLFKINIFTYLFFLLSILSGFYKDIIIINIILILHELGHFILMKLNKIKVYSITIYPYGGMIKSNMLINTSSIKIFFISIGGILFQLILFLLFFVLNNLNAIDINIYKIFLKYNTYIILFNILPIYPLDGFKIINSLLEIKFNFKKSLTISTIINCTSLILFYIYLYKNKISNYMIIIFLLINLINYIKELKYIMNKFYIERYLYDLNYNGLISINKLSDMYKNKLNYINGIEEKIILVNKFNKL